MENRKEIVLWNFIYAALIAGLVIILMSGLCGAVVPSGANVSFVNSSTAPADVPTSAVAQAGNVTELNIRGYSTTQTWQGYFGNVTGTIQLADSSGKAMYNWTDASPKGEVYSSTNSSIQWFNILCFNFSATGTHGGGEPSGGGTSLYGTNLSQLESQFNISSSAVDGIDETFIYSGIQGHEVFYSAQNQFSQGECRSTRIFSSAGYGEQGKFEEVLLYEPNTASVIFASLIENNLAGFDSRTHDFEMLVPEDGHNADTQTTRYYFYVELE